MSGNVLIVGQGGPDDSHSLELQTRERWRIPNELRTIDKTAESLVEGVKHVLKAFSAAGLQPVRATAQYNCAGLVFGSSRVWIEPQYCERILTDDGYEPLSKGISAKPGDIVLYRDNSGEVVHTGLVHEVKKDPRRDDLIMYVRSAWGETGEFLHPRDVVPSVLMITSSDVWAKRTPA